MAGHRERDVARTREESAFDEFLRSSSTEVRSMSSVGMPGRVRK
jgi:hypothetical protein